MQNVRVNATIGTFTDSEQASNGFVVEKTSSKNSGTAEPGVNVPQMHTHAPAMGSAPAPAPTQLVQSASARKLHPHA